MKIEKKRLAEISSSEIIDLLNNPLVRKHMPLATCQVGEAECADFIANKEKIWSQYGYGPWAFVVDGHFVGWGGLQPEDADVEIALVLHPKYWGIGRKLYTEVIEFAFNELKLESIIILFPPSRKNIKGLLKAGFCKDGEVTIEGKLFIRYRLLSSNHPSQKLF